MTLLESLETYLLDSRQIDPLARRQAGLICRCINNQKLQEEAHLVLFLVLAALQKGTPRANREYLLEPLAPEIVSFYKDTYHATDGAEPGWSEPLAGSRESVSELLSLLFDTPDLFSPLSGEEPADESGKWPLLVVSEGYTGFSRYWSSARTLEQRHLPAPASPVASMMAL
jgi:hypothetical protein